MKKVIILSYYFPPCNLTASQRALGWAKTLNKFGYYPIVITRSWDVPITRPEDASLKSGNEVIVKTEADYEIHYLPYVPSFRDRLHSLKKRNKVLSLLQKALTVIELLSNGITSFFIPYRNMYMYTYDFLKKNNDVRLLVATANPFLLFKFAYKLHRQLGISWIADYRDDWNTNELLKQPPAFSFAALIKKINKHNERRWVASALCITSISHHYTSKISAFTGKKGHVLLNGFFKEDFSAITSLKSDAFLIVYNGTLYDTQPIEKVLSAFRTFVDNSSLTNVKFLFLGTAYDAEQKKRIEKVAKQLSVLHFVEITERKPRVEALRIQASAHVLLMIGHDGHKGVPSSKLYEYLALEKPVVCYPGDKDIIDETLSLYNLGYISETEDQLTHTFEKLYRRYQQGEYFDGMADKNYIAKYSREHQTKILAEILNGRTY